MKNVKHLNRPDLFADLNKSEDREKVKTSPPDEIQEITSLGVHPLATLFPIMSSVEFEQFCKNIKENGLLEPIMVFNGQIIDGRHRFWACLLSGIKPRFITCDNDKAALVSYSFSKNLYRRHLSESERAMLAARLIEVCSNGVKAPWSKELDIEGGKFATDEVGKKRDLAARFVNVSPRLVGYAQIVIRQGNDTPLLVEAVDSGKIKVSQAAALTKLPEELVIDLLTPKEGDESSTFDVRRKVNLALKEARGAEKSQAAIQTIGTNNPTISDSAKEEFTLLVAKKGVCRISKALAQTVNTSDTLEEVEQHLQEKVEELNQIMNQIRSAVNS